MDKMKLVVADLVGAEQFGRRAEMSGKLSHMVDVSLNRLG